MPRLKHYAGPAQKSTPSCLRETGAQGNSRFMPRREEEEGLRWSAGHGLDKLADRPKDTAEAGALD